MLLDALVQSTARHYTLLALAEKCADSLTEVEEFYERISVW